MERTDFIKNFALGYELQISAKFLYDGLRDLNCINKYDDIENIFGFLYKTSVGIERLQKIAYILLKNPNQDEYKQIEEEIITHSTVKLQSELAKLTSIQLNAHQRAFLCLLSKFYKSCRYDRFNFDTALLKERTLFIRFIESNLHKKIVLDEPFVDFVTNKERDFFGRIIKGISEKYYEIIYEQATKLNLYTYEIDSSSKGIKIFFNKNERSGLQSQIIDEQIAFKELLIYLINTNDKNPFIKYLKSIKPLNIDPELIQDYLVDILKGEVPQDLIEELEELYSENSIKCNERIEELFCIGSIHCYFDSEDVDSI
jgi:hypothetical protein